MFLVDHFSWWRSFGLGKDSKDIVVRNNLIFFLLLEVLTVLQVGLASGWFLLRPLFCAEGREDGFTDVFGAAAIVVLPSKAGHVQLVCNSFGKKNADHSKKECRNGWCVLGSISQILGRRVTDHLVVFLTGPLRRHIGGRRVPRSALLFAPHDELDDELERCLCLLKESINLEESINLVMLRSFFVEEVSAMRC